MSMRHRRGLNEEQREALRELDARASHDTGWFTFRHDGGDVFALPHPDTAGGDIYLPAGTLAALEQGGFILLAEGRFQLTARRHRQGELGQ
jgi:hypothetical protein